MEFLSTFKHALMISFFVFVMMLLVDFIDTISKKRMSDILKGGKWRQYTLSSFFGSIPGCLGAFMNVSLYVRGIIGFGAVVGGMIATSGDEAFVMLSEFPGTALILFALLFICGVIFARVSDGIINFLGITPCKACLDADCVQCESDEENQIRINDIFQPNSLINNLKSLSFTRFLLFVLVLSFAVLIASGKLGPDSWDWERITFFCLSLCTLCITAVVSEHYLHSHVWDHIIKKHILRVFLWSFAALLFVRLGLTHWNLELFVEQHMWLVLIIGALISIIPESGPHLIFVMMFSQGLIPFSVLFTTSFIQDGHGMLPLLSYSLRDALLVKFFNLIFGLAVGGFLFLIGF
ncbi:MAG: arsenic efflux protein [Desulfobacteraceae bacterium]|nr:arsenic efflux protein [Desulfobacteraceae bacterium]